MAGLWPFACQELFVIFSGDLSVAVHTQCGLQPESFLRQFRQPHAFRQAVRHGEFAVVALTSANLFG